MRVARFLIKNWSTDTRIFEGNQAVPILDSDPALTARMCLDAGPSAPENCYTRWAIPVADLDRSVPHTLRVTRGGREGTITMQAHTKFRWVWFNFFLGPAAPVGLLVDAMTKNWTYFDDLDVARVLGETR